MRYLIGASLLLTACARDHEPYCELQPANVQAVYPDGLDRKSDVYSCEDGTFKVIAVDGSSSFTANGPPRVKEAP